MGFLSLCADVIFLLEVSGFPSITVSLVDMVKTCELTGFSFSVAGWLELFQMSEREGFILRHQFPY